MAMQENSARTMTRRQLVAGGAAGAAGAFMLVGLGGGAAAALADEPEWDYEADVVVVGGGTMGMPAAVCAVDEGASVILLEKTSRLGGNCFLSDGVVLGNRSKSDLAAGIDVSDDEVYDEGIYNYPACDHERNRWIIEQGGATLDWLEEHGVVFDSPADRMAPAGTYSDLPIYHTVEGGGSGYAPLMEYTENCGAQVMFETRGTGLYTSPAGEVIGVRAENAGGAFNVKAAKGVVLSTGGYTGNAALMGMFDYRYAGMRATGLQTNTGDGLMMAMGLGGVTLRTSGEILMGTSMGGMFSFIFGIGPYNFQKYAQSFFDDGAILVGAQGKRFMNEDHGDTMAVDVSLQQVADGGWEHEVYIVTDETPALDAVIDGAYDIYQADTPEELAGQIGVDPEGLAAEIAHYNDDVVAAGEDADFGRSSDELHKLEAPLYAIGIYSMATFSSGGLKVNDDCLIQRMADIDDMTDDPASLTVSIPRLYTGGDMCPYDCHGGYGVSKAFSAGRVSGKLAADAEPWE